MREVQDQREVQSQIDARTLCRRLRTTQDVSLLLDAAGASSGGWRSRGLVAIAPVPRLICRDQRQVPGALSRLEALLRKRRRRGGSASTGMAVLLAYDALDPTAVTTDTRERLPVLVALDVDRTAQVAAGEAARLSWSDSLELPQRARDLEADHLATLLSEPSTVIPQPKPARVVSLPRTSLPREAYLRGVQSVRDSIAKGDIYQANLCQRFSARTDGDAFGFYEALAAEMVAPHSAFLECPDFSLASVSPESFVTLETDGQIETMPIKGTRPRGKTEAEDRQAAEDLLASAKDRAELLMIVDLERNDLGRVCQVGSIHTPELGQLQSFSAVHHLVAQVRGTLRADVPIDELLRAIFPGGSITGAPKLRAIQILRALEPERRNFFTGSLFWFGDDGSVDSSILIRTAVLTGGQVLIGAGGGIVTDSDPEQEWLESNHKARALTTALGFDPEEAR